MIEVFDTVLGDSKATYRTTIQHDLILTPNNLVGISETSFYVTNDHSSKTAWVRYLSGTLFEASKRACGFFKLINYRG